MWTPAAYVRGVRHPEAFHGDGVTRGYFERWYVKLVSADRSQRWAVIAGVFRGLAGDDGARDEAFVQVLDGLTGRSWYHRFPASAFSASSVAFDVEVGGIRFGPEGVTLDLPQLRGNLRYTTQLEPWPVTVREPGIMGWYGLVPFMKCFRGIVSFGHGLAGSLSVEGATTSFDGGRGYIEKDWGRAFPAGYVWMASNHVDVAGSSAADWDPTTDAASDASLIASIAVVSWLRGSFRGSILGFRHSGRLHRWTSYNRSCETALRIDDSHMHWEMQGRMASSSCTQRGRAAACCTRRCARPCTSVSRRPSTPASPSCTLMRPAACSSRGSPSAPASRSSATRSDCSRCEVCYGWNGSEVGKYFRSAIPTPSSSCERVRTTWDAMSRSRDALAMMTPTPEFSSIGTSAKLSPNAIT